MKLTTRDNDYYLDDKPIKIYSGAIHYFRVFPEYWKERMLQLKALGFNTVETYVPWNLHQPTEGTFEFSGMADIEKFIKIADEVGLYVIVRPCPYICSEWEFGGLPWWLLKHDDIELRCMDERFTNYIEIYYKELYRRLVPLQSTQGGPIIAMQIENEYGSYGDDKKYLRFLKDCMIENGVDVLLFTSDGGTDHMLTGGTLPDVLKTCNFGSRPDENFKKLHEHQQNEPITCMEYWNGWFDHWGEEHHTRDVNEVAECFAEMVDMGASVNFYMIHGGTNFGFMSGANRDKVHQPTITSYDSHAPIGESGNLTEKYFAIKKVLENRFGKVDVQLPEPTPSVAYGEVELNEVSYLFDELENMSNPVKSATPLNMEKLDQGYGYVLYRCHVEGPREELPLSIQDVHDRALVFVDGEYRGTVERDVEGEKIMVSVPREGIQLDILVENCGRINYGPYLKDFKGITQGVRLNNQFLFGWKNYSLPMNNLDMLQYQEISNIKENSPAFYKGYFNVEEKGHTFLKLDGWHKGQVYINGFNIGRHYEVGPQKTYFVPEALLHEGKNEIVVFEQYSPDTPKVEFLENEILG
jgi:beta-galactosidase